MTIRAGVPDTDKTTVPIIINNILVFATQRSLEGALFLDSAKEVINGNKAVYNTIFTPARRDKRSPA
jgi:hypothetical protein